MLTPQQKVDFQDKIKTVLATMVQTSFRSRSFHWNVEGIFFAELHQLFGDVYGELDKEIDVVAEVLRTLDIYAPTSIQSLLEHTIKQPPANIPSAREMLSELYQSHLSILSQVDAARIVAVEDAAVTNVLDDLSTAITKRMGMLKASSK